MVFILAFLVQSFRQPFIMLGYYANKAAFAKNCENKAKPMLHCNGKCQAMKKLQQQEKKDQDMPDTRNDGKFEVLSSKSFFPSVDPLIISIPNTKLSSPLCMGLLNGYNADFFQPPRV